MTMPEVPVPAPIEGDTGRDWYSDTPPRDVFVWARYSCSQPWQFVKTCKHGCCVVGDFGCMMLPNFWREVADQTAARGYEKKLLALPKIDPWDALA